MCGIAGIHPTRSSSPDELSARLTRMAERLVHRGPDEEGFHVTPAIGLASRRLQVIDLAGGRMPVANEDGSVQVVYNGEIYNYRSLRKDLLSRGHAFRTTGDTEVLVHLYEEHGTALLEHLVGMFAFALWDADAETLYLARDRLGIKPLYYHFNDTELVFASELKALTAVARRRPAMDIGGLADYLALGYIRAPRTIYQGYYKLLPGGLLESPAGRVKTKRYWDVPRTFTPSFDSPDEAIDALDDAVRTAVRDRLIADVPLGAFLSGGVDSSLVVSLAAQETTGALKTFSVGFEGQHELPYARQVAEAYGTDHHELLLTPSDCHITDKLVDGFDEPFGDGSAIPTYFVSKLAREQVTVVLSGDGGDELFAGYNRYGFDTRWAWLDRIPRPLRAALFGTAVRLLPCGTYGWNLMRAVAASRPHRYSLHVAEELDPRYGGLLSRQHVGQVGRTEETFAREFADAATLPAAAQPLYVDTATYLPDDILTKVDRMSMIHSLEARVPLLDHRIVHLAADIPIDWKIRNGEQKRILKSLAERYVPREVLYRPKQGFSLPLSRWLLGEMSHFLDMLTAPGAHVRLFLHWPTVDRLVEEHRRGRRNHGDTLWRLAMLEYWFRRHGNTDRDEASELAEVRKALQATSAREYLHSVRRSTEPRGDASR